MQNKARRADNARRWMERQGGVASRSQGTRVPSQGARAADRKAAQGGLASPLAPSRRSISLFIGGNPPDPLGETEKGKRGAPGALKNTGDDACLDLILRDAPLRSAPHHEG